MSFEEARQGPTLSFAGSAREKFPKLSSLSPGTFRIDTMLMTMFLVFLKKKEGPNCNLLYRNLYRNDRNDI